MFEEQCLSQRLCEDVRHLVLGVNWMHSDVLSNMRAEEVKLHIDVFGSRTILRVVGNLNCTAVVLKDTTMHLCCCSKYR